MIIRYSTLAIGNVRSTETKTPQMIPLILTHRNNRSYHIVLNTVAIINETGMA